MSALGAVGLANQKYAATVTPGGRPRPIGKMKRRGMSTVGAQPKPKPKRELKHGQFRVI